MTVYRLPDGTELPEPADGAFVRTGDTYPFTFWYRDDETAREISNEPDEVWWDATDDTLDAVAWEVVARNPDVQLIRLQPVTR